MEHYCYLRTADDRNGHHLVPLESTIAAISSELHASLQWVTGTADFERVGLG